MIDEQNLTPLSIPHNWAPRDYQLPLWKYMTDGGKRAACIWHRRAGKDLVAINWCAVCMVQRPGTIYWHCLPTYAQGQKIIWDGRTNDGRSFLSAFPDSLIESCNKVDMQVKFKNGSIYQVVGTDNVDRLVGSNPHGIIFSEYSLQDPRAWTYTKPILVANGGWAIFIYTPRGYNHGYKLFQMAEDSNEWFSQRLTVEDTGVVSQKLIDRELSEGTPKEIIQQEYYCSFDAPLVGSYYGDAMTLALSQGRITKVPHDINLDVHTAWDLGVADSTAIWFFQKDSTHFRIIDYYEAQGESLHHYIDILKEKRREGYSYGYHFAPHDIQVKDFSSDATRFEIARKSGLRFNIIPKIPISEGIQHVRSLLGKCYFDKERCDTGLEALRQYTKSYNDKMQAYSSLPQHDWTSHACDAMRYLAIGVHRFMYNYYKGSSDVNMQRKKIVRTESGYNPF